MKSKRDYVPQGDFFMKLSDTMAVDMKNRRRGPPFCAGTKLNHHPTIDFSSKSAYDWTRERRIG